MSNGLTAAVLAYVRTDEGGVVEIQAGDPVPDGASAEHVDQLLGAGVLVSKGPAADKVDDVLDQVGDDPDKAAAALEVERAGRNRKTLVEALEKIATDDQVDPAS